MMSMFNYLVVERAIPVREPYSINPKGSTALIFKKQQNNPVLKIASDWFEKWLIINPPSKMWPKR